MLPLSARDIGSIRILPITGKYSLFPLSYTRTPYRLTLRLAYQFRKTGEVRAYRVLHKWQISGLGPVYSTGSTNVRVSPKFKKTADCLPFGSSLSTAFGSLYFTMFIGQFTFVDHTAKPSSSRWMVLSAVDFPSRFNLLLSERLPCRDSFAQKNYSLCTCP